MFKINYKLTEPEYEDFKGQEGFFQVVCNEKCYGDLYPKELEKIMHTVSVYDCFERYLRILNLLTSNHCVFLSDVDSFNLWIKFKRLDKDVLEISLVESNKPNGSTDLELEIPNFCYGEWSNEKVHYEQFKDEILEKTVDYLNKLKEYVGSENVALKLKEKLKSVV